jgi:hypothetical protein
MTLTLDIQNTDPNIIRSTDSILSSRFNSLCPDGKACVSSTVFGSTITYRFDVLVDRASVDFAYSQAGNFEVSLVDNAITIPIFSNLDVESAIVQGDAVLIPLNPPIHNSMLRISAENSGKKV